MNSLPAEASAAGVDLDTAQNTVPGPGVAQASPPPNLGVRLRKARKASGLTLRELASRLGVSPSFISQIENSKAQPSVATLYSLARLLDVSIDHLFTEPASTAGIHDPEPVVGSTDPVDAVGTRHATPVRRAELGGLSRVWEPTAARVSLTQTGQRSRLVMDTGVVWEQLATNTAQQIDFIEIVYPAGSTSTSDGRMLRHDGYEYGYLLEGELEITVGFEAMMMRAGDAIGLDSSVPHLFRNQGDVDARGIWFVHHRHD